MPAARSALLGLGDSSPNPVALRTLSVSKYGKAGELLARSPGLHRRRGRFGLPRLERLRRDAQDIVRAASGIGSFRMNLPVVVAVRLERIAEAPAPISHVLRKHHP